MSIGCSLSRRGRVVVLASAARARTLAVLAGVLVLCRLYSLLDDRFLVCLGVVSAGFLVHSFLPARFKQAFSLAVAFLTALTLLPASFLAGLLAAGAVFYLVVWWAPSRLAGGLIVAAVFLLMAFMRVQVIPQDLFPEAYWKYFGGIFMFRMIVYLRETEPGRPERPLDFLTYFFMAPNFYFWFFPVIGYSLFKRTYCPAPGRHRRAALDGAFGILRGILQLLAIRVLENHFYIEPHGVRSLADLLWYSFYAYASFLHISGSWHICIGMLRLFGYELPRPCLNYFLSRDLLDYWGRSNAYWRRFLINLVYMPLFLRLQAYGRTAAILVSAPCVFLVAWMFHVYQAFWFFGELRPLPMEPLNLGVLGTGVTITLLLRARRGVGARSSAEQGPRWLYPVQVLLTLLVTSLLWGLVARPSPQAWLYMLQGALR